MANTDKTTQVIQVIKAETDSINQLTESNLETANTLAEAIKSINSIEATTSIASAISKLAPPSIDYFAWATLIVTAIAAFGAVLSAYIGFSAYRGEVKRRYESDLESAIKHLDINGNSIAWRIGLKKLANLATTKPDDFFEEIMKIFNQTGKSFSEHIQYIIDENTDSSGLISLDCDRLTHTHTSFVAEILREINKIRVNNNCRKYINKQFHFDGFKIIYGSSSVSNWNFEYLNFSNLRFEYCDFSGIDFIKCNFQKSEFFATKKAILRNCLLSGNTDTSINNFWFSNRFPFPDDESKNFIWDDERGIYTTARLQDLEHTFKTPIPASQRPNNWERKSVRQKINCLEELSAGK
uniref:Pentapeptide repeat-containing protein n=1 Tax=OCS116 cluster bacterium TaxID=2030921 RepID=A0A2A4Z606_9PROT